MEMEYFTIRVKNFKWYLYHVLLTKVCRKSACKSEINISRRFLKISVACCGLIYSLQLVFPKMNNRLPLRDFRITCAVHDRAPELKYRKSVLKSWPSLYIWLVFTALTKLVLVDSVFVFTKLLMLLQESVWLVRVITSVLVNLISTVFIVISVTVTIITVTVTVV